MEQENTIKMKMNYLKPEMEVIEMEVKSAMLLDTSEASGNIPGMGNGGNIGPETW